MSLSGIAPGCRAAQAMCSVGSKIYIFGGRGDTERQNDLYIADLGNNYIS